MASFYRRKGKRILDVAGASVGIVISSPITLTTAIVVGKKMGSPVLFRQMRPGLHGQPFILLKFRTMFSPDTAGSNVESDAERITLTGRFLRLTSIDELPEFWNVLRGDMSLVGPRPLLIDYLDRYSTEQARRHEVRPGITGWAQVNGRNALTWDEKFTFDVWYVDHLSLRTDIGILWKTIKAVVNRKGIAADGHETMPEFKPVV